MISFLCSELTLRAYNLSSSSLLLSHLDFSITLSFQFDPFDSLSQSQELNHFLSVYSSINVLGNRHFILDTGSFYLIIIVWTS